MNVFTYWILLQSDQSCICVLVVSIWPLSKIFLLKFGTGSAQTVWCFYTPPQRSCRGVYWFHHARPSIRLSVCLQKNSMSYDNLSCVSQNLFKFYHLFSGDERRFFFDDFHFCRSRVIGLDMTGNMIFTLCRMITLVVFLRMF